jgi:hypothetical protein
MSNPFPVGPQRLVRLTEEVRFNALGGVAVDPTDRLLEQPLFPSVSHRGSGDTPILGIAFRQRKIAIAFALALPLIFRRDFLCEPGT